MPERFPGQPAPSRASDDLLAAACAACGDFAAAVRWQKEAARLAPARDRRGFQGRVACYRSGWTTNARPTNQSERQTPGGSS